MGVSFSTALSALSATSTAIDVTGNNLANMDTDGFKASTVSFHDLVTQSLGAGLSETQVGFGVGAPVTLTEFTQGATETTNNPLDAAITGDGFFIVTDPTSGNVEYTRGGNFQVDQAGNLETATGQLLQGWMAGADGTVQSNGPIGNITVPTGTLKPPQQTSQFSFDLNLDANATAGPPPTTFSTAIQIYDSLGTAHTLTATFTATSTPGQWNYSISVPDADLTAPFTPVTGTLTFNSSGQLTSPAATAAATQISITGFADGAADMTGATALNWNLFNGSTGDITQFASPSEVSALSQDGSAAAQLDSVGIANGGGIVATYSDGTQQTVGQLALATIRNPDSLVAVGDNNYQLSALSALPAVGAPGTGGRGQVLGGAVEQSTTNMATEFTNLIQYQSAYEASSKVITTVNQISQDTINLVQQ
jgi:flagellar hook protein FlgE